MTVTETFMVKRTAIGIKVAGGVALFQEPLAVWLDEIIVNSYSWVTDKEKAGVLGTKKEAISVAKSLQFDDDKWEFDKHLGTEILRQETETIVREVSEETIVMGEKTI